MRFRLHDRSTGRGRVSASVESWILTLCSMNDRKNRDVKLDEALWKVIFTKKKIKKWWLRHRIHFLYMRIQEHCDFISIQMLVFSRRSSSKNIFYFEFIYLFIY